MRIKRPKSRTVEPEPSLEVRELLLDQIRRKVEEVHGIEEYDPVIAMALIANDPVVVGAVGVQNPILGIQTALKAHGEVARYVHPTVKQVEVSGPGGGPVQVKSGLALEIADLLQSLGKKTEVPDATQPVIARSGKNGSPEQ